ncbi:MULTISPECIES: PhoU domain-containing protein [unclassified Amycolatopsis]|uniref:PhoU domain-containing protein n=1 Tax=unclassified Amycolatopsis TaxID=2618356 RepID=UPI002E22825A|nr:MULTISPECIES: PhoU domain-containing protein [unclassified Amycolatopsis]
MPTAFQKELVTLAHRLADLSGLVAGALEEATRGLLESDLTLGGRAREQAAAVTALGAACEDQACALLALHAPREEDVKAVVAAVHTAADLTRMGGLAREVADRARRVPSDARPAYTRLGAHTVAAARGLQKILSGEDAGLADAVEGAEAAERELREWAGSRERPHGAVDVALLAAAHTRFAGTAARIARRSGGFARLPAVSA